MRIASWCGVAMLTVSMLATGCKREEGDESSATGGATSRGVADGKTVRIVYIPKNAGNPYFAPFIAGMKKAADEYGAEFADVAPATADATSQIPVIKDQVQLGVDVLVISPNSPDALVPALDEARGKGVLVITADSDLTGSEDHRDAAVFPVDPKDVGFSQIETLGKLIDYKGKFAILSATTDAPNQNLWIGHMKEALKDPKYAGMQLVDIVYGDDQPQKSTTEAEALLTKHPDLRGLIAPTSVGIAAAAAVVENAKKADQVKLVGLGLPSELRRYVLNGTLPGAALWSPYDMGYVTSHLAVQLAQGKVKAQPGATFTAGTLGEREVGAKNVVIAGKPLVFTKENIDDFKF
ncbi:MAG: substrate-binding domain-containing protein [Deltaproteobacteria bacterium]|nr:substrate-binding domain-containing protein [Deltaproteobacteria bacterium]